MKSTSFVASLLIVTLAFVATVSAFAPRSVVSTAATRTAVSELNMVFGGDQEKKKLTRESEPEEYFQTNTDKMSDEEKLPIALAGIAFISLPFIAGLIALYAAK